MPQHQDGFADFLVQCWLKEFSHAYPITHHRAWHRWRAMPEARTVAGWSCENLGMAARRWSWYEAPDLPGFSQLARDLSAALRSGSDAEVEALCFDIFKWGGVATKSDDVSRVWVQRRARDGTLKARIRDAVELLKPSSTAALTRFDGDDLLMNSAMTKVYAAADLSEEVAIYDSRVGAALGLLSRRYLEANDIAEVPPVLMYHWGPARGKGKAHSRDPSSATHRYQQLPNGVSANRPRAEVSRRANRLLASVRERLARHAAPASLLELERALFMVGYQVNPAA